MVDGDGDVRVEEALHPKRPCDQGGLGEIFVFREREEGAVEVPIRNEYGGVSTRMGPKREDPRDGRLRSCERAVMASTEAAFNARAISEGEEGSNKVVGVGNRVDVD